jgi:hypothetical protein
MRRTGSNSLRAGIPYLRAKHWYVEVYDTEVVMSTMLISPNLSLQYTRSRDRGDQYPGAIVSAGAVWLSTQSSLEE